MPKSEEYKRYRSLIKSHTISMMRTSSSGKERARNLRRAYALQNRNRILAFEKIASDMTKSLRTWCAHTERHTYMVCLDLDHRHLGYSASWRNKSEGGFVLLPEKFKTLDKAQGALREIASHRRN